MIPAALQNIPGITEYDHKFARGIYFLFHKDELVYIGRSWNVYVRIQQHIDKGEKVFDRSFVQLIPIGISTAKLERQYILKLQPKYNYEVSNGIIIRPEPMSSEEFIAKGREISKLL